MTFSDARIKKLLSTRFVCAWKNTIDEPNAGASFCHVPGSLAGGCMRGNGEHNVQLLFLTPGGKLLNAVSGYIAPDELVAELEFVLSTHASLSASGRASPASRVKKAQEAFLKVVEKKETFQQSHGRAKSSRIPKGIMKRVHDNSRLRVLTDHRFVEKNPLLPIEKFRSEDLVGSNKTFFGSSSGGHMTGTIGDAEGTGLNESLKRITAATKKE